MLCLFIAIGAFPVCLLRATLGPGIGIICNLGFGVVIIAGQFAWAPTQGYKLIWKDVRPTHTLAVVAAYASVKITNART